MTPKRCPCGGAIRQDTGICQYGCQRFPTKRQVNRELNARQRQLAQEASRQAQASIDPKPLRERVAGLSESLAREYERQSARARAGWTTRRRRGF